MNYETYSNLYIKEDYSIFDFFSIGPKGVIPKRITFNPTDYPSVYSIVFGDIDVKGEINDYSISNNGDRNKLLATIAYVIDIYLKQYPERYVYFTGSTEERTRLYRMAIGLNFEYLSDRFDIYCQNDTGIFKFQKNMDTIGFLIRLKA